jgi:hypothetical protein
VAGLGGPTVNEASSLIARQHAGAFDGTSETQAAVRSGRPEGGRPASMYSPEPGP